MSDSSAVINPSMSRRWDSVQRSPFSVPATAVIKVRLAAEMAHGDAVSDTEEAVEASLAALGVDEASLLLLLVLLLQ